MNLFRPEGHARHWGGFGNPAGLITLDGMKTLMSAPLLRERPNGHYLWSYASYPPGFVQTPAEVTIHRAIRGVPG